MIMLLKNRKIIGNHHPVSMIEHKHIIETTNQIQAVYVLVVQCVSIWGFPTTGVPENGRLLMENPIKLDDLGVPPF
jgi:hypothetical protein